MKAYTVLLAGAALLAACSQSASTSRSASASTAEPAAASTPTTASTAVAPPAELTSRRFPTAEEGEWGVARVISLTGADTDNAAMTGRVGQADAQAFCAARPAGNPESAEACATRILAAQGERLQSAGADCTRHRLSWMGDAYSPERAEGGYLVFRSEEHSQLQVNTAEGGGILLNDLYSTLCPADFRARGGTRANP